MVSSDASVNVNTILDGQVSLDLECLDRIYLNGYVPNLQVSGQVAVFMRDHLGLKIPSPAVFERIGTKFRRAVGSYAEANHIPVVRFTKDDRKIQSSDSSNSSTTTVTARPFPTPHENYSGTTPAGLCG